MKSKPLEVLLWSIALPGFGQLLNKQYLKGVVLIALEFLINIGSHLNLSIMYSFKGDILAAIQHTDYQWLMFYPCVYMFGIWDAFKAAGGGATAFSALPFVSCAYFGTVGVMYSDMRISGVLLGPVWLPMLSALFGIALGIALKAAIGRHTKPLAGEP
ncbi:hypothetical protein [Paenibacillus thermotolerans]|uniref:hypothetical protein n=1 Tax=Paenibacillus thermotolerans TaxID=3027807 RepID=UPI002368A4F5|nr:MULTISPECIES: hypothetical protein [unclassified Paenibacillus]